MAPGDRRGAQIVDRLFGANFQEQGRGYYVALEFLAICRGVLDAGGQLFEATGEMVTYERRSHDLARRLAVSAEIPDDVLRSAIRGDSTRRTLEALFSSLVVTIPGRRTAPQWYGAHLYPFVGELIHYDAVFRSKPKIERYVFRDSGGLVYRIMRSDRDAERLERTRRHVEELVADSDTALGRIAAALTSHDQAEADSFKDESESKTNTRDDSSPWPEILRTGVDRITSRLSVPRARRVDQLLHWLPYCVARHQLRLARRRIGKGTEVVLTDTTTQSNPIRSRSQRSLIEFRTDIVSALRAQALLESREHSGESGWDKFTRSDARFTASPRAFFSESLAAVGALNAVTGRRHFVLKPPLLEAIVSATVEPEREVEFEEYCELLRRELGIVIGPSQARREGLTSEIDAAVFSRNAWSFRSRLETAGLLTRYSDATDLVHAEVDR